MTDACTRLRSFVEKPDAETAARYLADGYLWNSGNFMFRASMLLDEYRSVDAPSVEAVSDAVVARPAAISASSRWMKELRARASRISIDYAVMEKTERAAVIPVTYGWSDVGSWRSVWELSGKDEDGNTARGTCGVRGRPQQSRRPPIVRWWRCEGVEDLVVVATQDAVLVASQDNAAGMKRSGRAAEAGGART